MNAITCERCNLTFDEADPELTLSRCRDAECPMKRKKGLGRAVLLVGAALGVTVLVIGGAVAGISALTEKPTGLQEAAERRAHQAAERRKFEADRARSARLNAQPAPAGGTGIAKPGAEVVRAAPVAAGPLPQVNPAAALRVTSFPCTGKLSAGRAIVCSDVGLATSDYNLSLLFKSVALGRSEVRRSQEKWRNDLDRIGNDKVQVAAHYRRRFDELSLIQAGVN